MVWNHVVEPSSSLAFKGERPPRNEEFNNMLKNPGLLWKKLTA
jgi:hypothetical protein